MENTTMNTTEQHITSTIDYASIEVRLVRDALAAAKNKEHLITIAVSIGVLTSKASKAAKTIKVDALRAQIEDVLGVVERRVAAEKQANNAAPIITETYNPLMPENAGRHAAPKMMPGQTPYTPEEQAKLSRLVSDAARADVTERDEVEGNVHVLAQPITHTREGGPEFPRAEPKRFTSGCNSFGEVASMRERRRANNRRKHRRTMRRLRHNGAVRG